MSRHYATYFLSTVSFFVLDCGPTLKTKRKAEPDAGQLKALIHKSGHLQTVTPMPPSPRVWSVPQHSKPIWQISLTRLSSVSKQNASCCESSFVDLPSSRNWDFFSRYSFSKLGLSTFLISEMLTARSRSFISHVWRLIAYSISLASLESAGKVY